MNQLHSLGVRNSELVNILSPHSHSVIHAFAREVDVSTKRLYFEDIRKDFEIFKKRQPILLTDDGTPFVSTTLTFNDYLAHILAFEVQGLYIRVFSRLIENLFLEGEETFNLGSQIKNAGGHYDHVSIGETSDRNYKGLWLNLDNLAYKLQNDYRRESGNNGKLDFYLLCSPRVFDDLAYSWKDYRFPSNPAQVAMSMPINFPDIIPIRSTKAEVIAVPEIQNKVYLLPKSSLKLKPLSIHSLKFSEVNYPEASFSDNNALVWKTIRNDEYIQLFVKFYGGIFFTPNEYAACITLETVDN